MKNIYISCRSLRKKKRNSHNVQEFSAYRVSYMCLGNVQKHPKPVAPSNANFFTPMVFNLNHKTFALQDFNNQPRPSPGTSKDTRAKPPS